MGRQRQCLARLVATVAVIAVAGVAQATPITYLFAGTASGTIGATPFTGAEYVVTLSGDTAGVVVFSGFPFPGTVRQNSVTATMSITGIGVATFTESALAQWEVGVVSFVGGPVSSKLLSVGSEALLSYDLQEPIGPLVAPAPEPLSFSAQTDLGTLTLSSASDVTFLAITTCGNGILDAGEQCDDGNYTSGDCCSPTCQFDAPNAACSSDGLACTADRCDGAGLCTHAAGNAGATCRAATGPCDTAELCSGISAACPPDVGQADGIPCSSVLCNPGGGTCQSGVCVGGAVDCDDHLPCTQDSCNEAIGCVHNSGPASGCLAAQKSTLVVKPSAVTGQATVSWRWTKGAALALTDLSDPTVDASYALCIYAGAPGALVADTQLPAGAKWSSAGTTGFRFKDNTPPTAVRLRSGAAGRSVASFAGRGVTLEQILPFDAPVIVQLHKSGSPLCLESQFVTPQRSDATKFKGRTP